jgi:DNA repair exonuclease SbcCD nuclease subunit
VIGANVLDDTPVLRDGVSIAGINYLSGRDLVDKLQKMVDYGIKTDILVMHFALAEMNGGGSADTGVQELSPLLDKLGVKAVLMGHVHIPDVRVWNGVLYVNPGSTEMKSYNEPRDKFFMVVDTDNLKPEAVEKVLIPTRKVVDVELNSEDDVIAFKARLQDDEKDGVSRFTNGPLYNVIADAELEDVFKRVSQFVKETNALCRIVVCAKRDRDVAPVIDRKESVATLESAIEARFPIESQEARLISDMLRSPEPSAIHARVEKFMQED